MTSTVLGFGVMTLCVTGGAIALKYYADTDSLYLFTLSLSLYMAGTAVMGELLRGGVPLGTMILTASILQLVLVQLLSVFAFAEPFRLTPLLVSLLAVFLLLHPTKNS